MFSTLALGRQEDFSQVLMLAWSQNTKQNKLNFGKFQEKNHTYDFSLKFFGYCFQIFI